MPSIPRLDLRPGVTDPVVLLISRREIESRDIASVTGRLKPFLATREDAWLYRGQMSLVIDGYNNDPRELVDISEVREFLRIFDKQWPYWAFFFNHVDDSIKIYLSCVCGVGFPGDGAVEIDADKLSEFLMHGFAGMNCLFDRFGFSETELEIQGRGVIEVVEQA